MTETSPAGANPATASTQTFDQTANVDLDVVSTPKLHADPDEGQLKPATNVHSAAIATALAAYGVFMVVAWIVFGRGYAALDLTVVVVISAVLFGLLVGGAMMSRNMTPDRAATRTFTEFVTGNVDTATGPISGRAALVQIAAMPILLAVGGTLIAAIWLIES